MRIDESRGTQQAAATENESVVASAATQVEEVRPSWERRPTPPRIYLASLTDYNAGVLHGKWVDADNQEVT